MNRGTRSSIPPVTPGLVLHIKFQPDWDYLDRVRDFVQGFCELKFTLSSAQKIATVSHELLENAVKFGSPVADVEFYLHLGKSADSAIVRVRNQAVSSRIRLLEEHLKQLESLPPREAYHDAMVRSVTAAENAGGIGLARIRYEASVDLSVRVDNHQVQVTARPAA